MSLSLYLIHDTRFKKKSGRYPVKLCANFERIPRKFQTIYDLTVGDWEKLDASRVSNYLQEVRQKLRELEAQAIDFASKMDPFSFTEFEKTFILNNPLFKQRKFKEENVPESELSFDYTPFHKRFTIFADDTSQPGKLAYSYFIYIKRLLREGRIGTAMASHCAYKALVKFRGNLRLNEVDPSYCRQFEYYWLKDDKSKTTVGIYLRSLRAIYNDAIEQGVAKKINYPFGKRKYQIPGGRNIKKALSFDRIAELFNYTPTCPGEAWGLDYWLFFYLANGLNPKDAALLKYKNIKEDFIIFYRAKTENTTRLDPKPITVYLVDEIKGIVERQGNKDHEPNNYIFPILRPGMTDLQIFYRIQDFIRLVNKWIKRICKNLNFSEDVSTIVARHTCATVLKNSGATTEFIQETLGHTDKRTTENYLGSFIPEIKKDFAAKLIPIKKEQEAKQVS